MPNEVSNEVHTLLDDAKVFFVKELAKAESGFATLIGDVKTVLGTVADKAGPIVAAAASAGVQAALANATGGLSAIASAAEGAAVSVLASQGVQLAEEAGMQLKTLVLGNVLKANSSPTVPPSN